MLRYIGRRLAQMVVLFVVFLSGLFFLLQAQPGNIGDLLIGNPEIPPEVRTRLLHQMGLDQSVWHQYVNYIGNFFRLNLGVSFSEYPRPVANILMSALPRTILLFLSATLLAYWLGFITGKYVAWRRGSFGEQTMMMGGVLLYTVFYPWFALLMIWLFSSEFRLFPTGKFITVDKWSNVRAVLGIDSNNAANVVFNRMLLSALAASLVIAAGSYLARRAHRRGQARAVFWSAVAVAVGGLAIYWLPNKALPYAVDIGYHTTLPVITLTLVFFAGITLLTRTSMLETLREDYIMTARAKGLPDRAIRDHHAARNALLPVTTSFVLALALVIAGGIVTESVFSWPGIGLKLLDAVSLQDIPLAMGALAMIGVMSLLAHLAADILYAYLDPRIRYT